MRPSGQGPRPSGSLVRVREELCKRTWTQEDLDTRGLGHKRTWTQEDLDMCRSIKTLHNFQPPATDEAIRASALQFVRKLSGFARPSQANQVAFERAVEQVTAAAHDLLASLVTSAPARDRDVEAAKARAKAAERYRASDAPTGR